MSSGIVYNEESKKLIELMNDKEEDQDLNFELIDDSQ